MVNTDSYRRRPLPAKLFIGMISSELPLFDELIGKLSEIFGHIDMQSPVWEWNHTDHYLNEMGAGLKRKFIFFKNLISPGDISEIKLKTTDMEGQYINEHGGRRINIDPGYLDSARIVLVSTKDYSHRVYIGNGIYGETTLIYSGKDYQILPYTYPDFRMPERLEVFRNARKIYKASL